MDRRSFLVGMSLGELGLLGTSRCTAAESQERLYAEFEAKLKPLAIPLAEPQPGDWLAEHREEGQTFADYRIARPVRKSRELGTIYLCLLGEFTREQRQVLDTAQKYLEIFYQVPVKVHTRIAV